MEDVEKARSKDQRCGGKKLLHIVELWEEGRVHRRTSSVHLLREVHPTSYEWKVLMESTD